jgi:outer membrane protein TolC
VVNILIKKYWMISILTAGLFTLSFSFTGCALNTTAMVDERELQSMRAKNLQKDIKSLNDKAVVEDVESTNHIEPVIDGPLTLEDAIEYAIKFNLDAAITKLERDIQEEAVVGAKLKMLPSLTLGGELGYRDKYNASFSSPLFGEEGFQAFNYSRDKATRKFDLELSWNLLDFGISYYQQRQAFNRFRITEQTRRRVIQNLKLDVTKTFWQMQVSQAAMQIADRLIDRLQKREKILLNQIESRLVSEIDVLETTTALSEMKMKMSGFEQEFQKHKHKLATLMGLTKQLDFELEPVDFSFAIEKIDINLKALETEALHQRPELYEQDLKELITIDEARITVTKMAPSASIFYRFNYDADSHLFYNDWHDVGLKLSFDLLSIPYKKSRQREVIKTKELIKKSRLSIAAAILTQLNIAVVDYEYTIQKYSQAKDIESKREQLMEGRRRHAKLGNGKIEDVLKSEGRHLFSQVRSLSTYADLMIAKQRIFNTIGSEEIGSIHFLKEDDISPSPNAQKNNVTIAGKPSHQSRKENRSEKKQTAVPDNKIKKKDDASHISRTSESRFPYSLHLSSWRTLEKALKMITQYRKKGLTPYAVKVNYEKSGIWWRCYSGYYKTKKEADIAITKGNLIDVSVKKTPHANLIGCYKTKNTMQDMSRKLNQMGFFTYAIKGENDIYRLFTGAFYTIKGAEAQRADLQSHGIQSQVALR